MVCFYSVSSCQDYQLYRLLSLYHGHVAVTKHLAEATKKEVLFLGYSLSNSSEWSCHGSRNGKQRKVKAGAQLTLSVFVFVCLFLFSVGSQLENGGTHSRGGSFYLNQSQVYPEVSTLILDPIKPIPDNNHTSSIGFVVSNCNVT